MKYFVCIHMPGGFEPRTEEFEDCNDAIRLTMIAIDAGARVNCGKCRPEVDQQ